jgi:hypothetical protein
MDTDEKKANEASKTHENEQSRNINNIKMFIREKMKMIKHHSKAALCISEIVKSSRESK